MEYSPYITEPKQSWKQGIQRMTSIPYAFYMDNREKPWDYRRVCEYIDDPTQFIKDHYASYKKTQERIDALIKKEPQIKGMLGYSDELWDVMEDEEERQILHFDYLSKNPFVSASLREKYPEFSKNLFNTIYNGVIMVPPYATKLQVENYILNHTDYSLCYTSSVNERNTTKREWVFIYHSDIVSDRDEIIDEYEVQEEEVCFHSPVFHKDGTISLYIKPEEREKVLDRTTQEPLYKMLYKYLMFFSSHFVTNTKH